MLIPTTRCPLAVAVHVQIAAQVIRVGFEVLEERPLGRSGQFTHDRVFVIKYLDPQAAVQRPNLNAECGIILGRFEVQVLDLVLVVGIGEIGHTVYIRHGTAIHPEFVVLAWLQGSQDPYRRARGISHGECHRLEHGVHLLKQMDRIHTYRVDGR